MDEMVKKGDLGFWNYLMEIVEEEESWRTIIYHGMSLLRCLDIFCVELLVLKYEYYIVCWNSDHMGHVFIIILTLGLIYDLILEFALMFNLVLEFFYHNFGI